MTRKRPPKDWPCEASVGWHSDQSGKPVIDSCPNMATEVVKLPPLGSDGYLCFSCKESMINRGIVK